MLSPKKNSYKEFDNEKIPAARTFPPHNFSNGPSLTYCFLVSCWLADNHLSWNDYVLLLSRNPIGQLCLGGPVIVVALLTRCDTFW